MEITFDHPFILWFLLALPLMTMAHYYNWRYKKKEALMFANFEAAARVLEPTIIPAYPFQLTLRIFIFLCLVFSAAGMNFWYIGPATDVNFALAIDSSSSMSAEDFQPDRLSAAKEFAAKFVEALPIKSKVVIVPFAGASFPKHTLSDDHAQVIDDIDSITIQGVGGTDIGQAIITSANLLLNEENKSKSIILLTDGQSTVGIPVSTAIQYAQNFFITVNTIGVGTEEGAGFYGEEDAQAQTKLDFSTLENIAVSTGGRYYRVDTKEKFDEVYMDISQEVYKNIKIGLTPYLISAVIMLLIINWILSFTKYSSLP
ncbi:VWA domain-containing protein [Candidatus Woesearchaeota archaeon]|nr:VWA domain-containing protein [Candidatus Woesearchaeota archaeon]